jgi:hypothetical protein
MQDPEEGNWLDLIVPIAAILVIGFWLGSIMYDPDFRLRPNRSDLLKAYAPNSVEDKTPDG